MRLALTPPSPFWADLESPLADRLAVLWCADGNYDIISRSFGVLSGSSPPVLNVGDVGRVYTFPGGGASVSYIDLGVRPQHADIAKGSPFTVFAVYSSTGNGTIACHSDNNAVNAGWLMGFNTSGQALAGFIERASSNISIGTGSSQYPVGTLPTSPFRTAAMSHDGLNTTSSGAAFLDGRQIGSSLVTTTAGSGIQGSDSAQHLYIGGNNSGLLNNCFSGSIKMVAVWRRLLNAGELLQLHLDPLALYRSPARRRNRVAGLAGGGAAAARPVVFVCT